VRLAALPPLEYEKLRKEEASSHGVRTSSLDQAVKEARRSVGVDSDLPFLNVEPWPEKVNPAEILSDITTAVRRFIICDEPVSIAVALWCAMTWFLDVILVCPLAVITAPEKRCGKTQLLTVIGRLVCRAITASSISPAALYRSIDAWKGTTLLF
jgi:putative DNA primase/helicase